MPVELAEVAGLTGESLVAVVSSAEAKPVLGWFPLNVPRPGSARDPKGRPEFTLILAAHFDRIMGAGRAAVRPIRIAVVAVHTGIANDPMPAEREFKGKQVSVRVPHLMIGSNRTRIADHVISIRMPSTVVAGIGQREGP